MAICIPVRMSGVRASKRALVDEDESQMIRFFTWRIHANGYAVSEVGSYRKGTRRHFRMHHLIKGKAPEGKVVDHINGDPLDNRKSNLRFCTQAENTRNSKRSKDNVSGYKGVAFDNRIAHKKNPWVARIKFNYKKIHLGSFPTAETANFAYQKAAKKLFGNFVRKEL